MAHPRSAFGASPSRGRHQWPGKAGSTVARACVICLLAVTGSAFAQSSPVGLWRNIDDKTGEAKAEIRITDNGGKLTGKIEKTLKKDAKPTCDECKDERKGQPMAGLEIIRGVSKGTGEDWEGGKILDPENGKEYTVRLTPVEGGQKLQVRGYLGPFYRTQVWVRVQ
ncbi:DUF2147 domain-containing protein [Ramlibacter sp. G-1-2-2]|uniref:DUF2147 domain-containing protein n=1 Tax=Ramlibacter agri TaxID=2728837 RepID=A0A848HEA3_9BURK|nr:DUF2147 domain-containing protein [Ramlibacter agri]